MKKNYFTIIALLLCVFSANSQVLHKKGNLTKMPDRLQTATHPRALRMLGDSRSSQFELQKLEDYSAFQSTKNGHSSALRAVEATELLDSVVRRNIDETYSLKNVYAYNEQGSRILYTIYNWDSQTQQWISFSKYEYDYNYAYNAGGDQTLSAYYRWNVETGDWRLSNQTVTEWSMDAENNKTFVEISSYWDNETQSLKYSSKEESVLQGNTYYYKYQTRYTYTVDGTWQPVSKFEQIYDEDGYDSTHADYSWNSSAGVWIGTNKQGYSSSADDTYTQYSAVYHWNSTEGDWTTRTETEYDSNDNEIATAEYTKNGGNWLAISKTGKEGEYTVYYDVVNNTFVKTYKDVTYYDGNGNLRGYYRRNWDAEDEIWGSSIDMSCLWDNLSGEWRVCQYIETETDKNVQLYRIQLYRPNSLSEWSDRNLTYKFEDIYDETGKQTARIYYDWAGGEPTVYEKAFNFGDFTATATSYFNDVETWTVNISEDVNDPQKVWITNLVAGGSSASSPVYGFINEEKTEIKIPVGQQIAISASYDILLKGYFGPDGETDIPSGESITGKIDPDGTIHIQDEFGSIVHSITNGSEVGWYNIFQADGIFVPAGKQNNYEWSFNWIESQRATYYYSEHDVESNLAPAYEIKLQAFPNPANDRMTVSGTKAGQKIRIANLSGQQTATFTAEEGNTSINVSSFVAGVYVVTIDNFSVKIIKK
ncbi:hypothetical protein FACS189413_08080 [Bacteroidia bacterium]|nr:hypothetical protein FACS189413_08080 [Bacteroidia bacterium]